MMGAEDRFRGQMLLESAGGGPAPAPSSRFARQRFARASRTERSRASSPRLIVRAARSGTTKLSGAVCLVPSTSHSLASPRVWLWAGVEVDQLDGARHEPPRHRVRLLHAEHEPVGLSTASAAYVPPFSLGIERSPYLVLELGFTLGPAHRSEGLRDHRLTADVHEVTAVRAGDADEVWVGVRVARRPARLATDHRAHSVRVSHRSVLRPDRDRRLGPSGVSKNPSRSKLRV